MVDNVSYVWSLKFISKEVERTYWEFLSKKYWKDRCALAFVILVFSILNVCYQFFFHDTNSDWFKASSIIELVLRILCTVFIKFIKNSNKKYIIHCFNYFLLTILAFTWNLSIQGTIDIKNYDNLIWLNLMEMLVRILYLNSAAICFFSSLIIHFVSLILILASAIYLDNYNDTFHVCIGYPFYFIIFTLLAYLFEFYKKQSYFYLQQNSKIKIFSEQVYEIMHSGLVSVRDNKVSYVSKWLKDLLDLEKYFKDNGGVNKNKEENLESLVNFLLGDIKQMNTNISLSGIWTREELKLVENGRNNHLSDTQTNFFINVLSRLNNELGVNSDNFHLLGIKSFHLNEEKVKKFEVLCRKAEYQGNENYDFIFNEVQEKNVQIKEDSLDPVFLAKVAHEFKNPLICIIELVHQLCDSLKKLKEKGFKKRRKSSLSASYNPEALISSNTDGNLLDKELNDNLHQINSLSNYLIILIKDFDYFSQKKKAETVQLEIEDFILEDILIFCREVGLCLLKKSEKLNDITFDFEVDSNVPTTISTDQFKLKQILINLLSNAIKFTTEGTIKLKVSLKETDIVFCVEDTGIGIKNENKIKLFCPYKISEKNNCKINNTLGAGLGLSIVRDLTSAIGKEVQFSSEVDKGSKFWFSIPYSYMAQNRFNSAESSGRPHNIVSVKWSSTRVLKETDIKDTIISNNALKKTLVEEETELYKLKKSSKNNSQKEEFHLNPSPSSSYNHTLSNHIGENIILEGDSSSDDGYPKETVRLNDHVLTINKDFLNFRGRNINVIEKNASNTYRDYIITVNQTANNPKNLIEKISRESVTSLQSQSDPKTVEPINLFKGGVLSFNEFIDKSFRTLKSEHEKDFNIIIVDDEKLSRMATRRRIIEYTGKNRISINIMEADDGIDCLFLVYNSIKKGIKIAFILCDQAMNFLDGSSTAVVLKQLSLNEKMKGIPFYLITAYENVNTLNLISSSAINSIYSKPLDRTSIDKIFSNFKVV